MDNKDSDQPTTHRPAMVWSGRIISGLIAALFVMSASMKLVGGQQVEEGMEHLGMPESMVVPLAVVELSCVVIYLIPRTSVLGAILLTGYMGGAICAHWRAGDPFIQQIGIGILVWLGLYLRENRLWRLVPLRLNQSD